MGLALRRWISQTDATTDDNRPSKLPFFLTRRPGFSVGAAVSHFRLLEWLGQGERGFEVWLARDLDLGRSVALKLLVSDRRLHEVERQLLRREVEAVSALHHPNLCPVYEVGETRDGVLFVAMACCEGESLADRIARGPLDLEIAVDLAAQVAEGLARVHAAGFVHRSLKPSDVLISAEGRAWITDFGLGRLDERTLVSGECGQAPSRYLSPEQVRGADADARSDVWGLGTILYEMVTGRPAFPQGPCAGAEVPPPMYRLRESVPSDLQKIVARALAFRPAERYASAREMAADLRRGVRPGVWKTGAGRGNLGPYRIAGLLGGGGMGVVYRAEDTRLGRQVAIKLLPSEMTRDPGAKARFLQEARAASALDHPNLCTVYEVGEAAGGQLYLAMPCYDGATLRERLDTGGPLPLAEALDYAAQTLKGLAKAHRSGIVHRDVKPANLMVTSDGVVKILDFGIAKLAGMAADLTQTGARIGTPAYMSPEQARGDDVDARTDLWSVGMVLYEMLAGARPDPERPVPVRRLRPEAPAEVERILRRLLARDRQERYATAEAALSDLRVFLGTTSGNMTATGDLVPVARRALRLWAGGALALAFLGAAVGYGLRWEREERNHLQRIGGGNATSLTPNTPREDTRPAFSPDGEPIAFRSERDDGGLFLMGATGESVRRLTVQPSWSPGGSRIAYWRVPVTGGRRISTVPASGGEPLRVLADGSLSWHPVWSADGAWIYFASDRSGSVNLWRLPRAQPGRALAVRCADPREERRPDVDR